MASKLVITTWLLAVFTIYVASFQMSGYGQLSISPCGKCAHVECHEAGDRLTACDLSWIVVNEKKSRSFNFRNTEAFNTYEVINAKGETIGLTLKIQEKEGVTKLTLQGKDGAIKKTACITKTREPTDKEKAVLKELCNEMGMHRFDKSSCS